MKKSFFDKYGVGLFVVVFGAWFLLKKLDIITFGFGTLISYAIPIIVIMYGLSMINNSHSKQNTQSTEESWSKYNPEHYDYKHHAPPPPPPLNEDPRFGSFGEVKPEQEQKQNYSYEANEQSTQYNEYKQHKNHNNYDFHFDPSDTSTINKSSFIGDFHFGKNYWQLKPMNLSHFIGDTVIDLTRAQIPLGETKINITSFIGDIKIYVPNDITLGVKLNNSAFIGESKFFGDKEGGIFSSVEQQSPMYYECERQIFINVSTFIGDVTVKKVG